MADLTSPPERVSRPQFDLDICQAYPDTMPLRIFVDGVTTWYQMKPYDVRRMLSLRSHLEEIARFRFLGWQGNRNVHVTAHDEKTGALVLDHWLPAFAAQAHACPNCGYPGEDPRARSALAQSVLR